MAIFPSALLMRSPKLPRFIRLALISMATAIACSVTIHWLALHFGWDALPLLYQIPMGLGLLTLFFMLPLLAGALVGLGVLWVHPRHKGKPLPHAIGAILGFYGFLLCHMVASATTSLIITEREMDRVEAFSDRLISELEDYKTQYGDYPETLDGFKSPSARPYFLRDQPWFYTKNTSGEPGYNLSYSNPWNLSFDHYSYDSTQREWVTEGFD